MGRIGPCRRTRVNVKVTFILIGLELMAMAGDQNVDVQLPLNKRKALRITPRYHLVAMAKSNPELAYSDHFLVRIVEV